MIENRLLRCTLCVVLVCGAVFFLSCGKDDDDVIYPASAKVSSPQPTDGATGVPVTVNIGWGAATGADSYHIYFGTSASEVSAADPSTTGIFRGNLNVVSFDPGSLSYLTTFYWRIDSVNTWYRTKGDTWSFTTEDTPLTPPDKVTGPTPPNGQTGVPVSQILSWSAAARAASYDVYFGTDQAAVTAADNASQLFMGNQTALSRSPGALNYLATYYWRIDSVNAAGTTKGDTSSFTTEENPATAPDEVTGLTPPDGQVDVPVDQILSWSAANGAASYDVYLGTDQAAVAAADNLSPEFAGNQTALTCNHGALAYSTSYYWRVDSVNPVGTTKGDTISFTTAAEPPQADFTATPTTGTTPLLVTFSDASTGPVTSWDWDFGDGGTSTERYPQHTYLTEGYFDVTLTATGPGGSDTRTRFDYINVGSLPILPEYCWTRTVQTGSTERAYDACTDGSDNVYVTGVFAADTDFQQDWGGTDVVQNAGGYDAFIMKIDSSGAYGWTRRIGCDGGDATYAVAADGNNNIYLAGTYTSATVNFAEDWLGSDVKLCTSAADAFITKIDSSGDYGWTRVIRGSSSHRALDVCTDINNNVYVAGNFSLDTNFAADWGGTDIKTAGGGGNRYVTKIDSAGDYCWTAAFGSSAAGYHPSICTDGSANLYVINSFTGTFDFAAEFGGTDEKTSTAASNDTAVTKIAANGTYCWTYRIGGTLEDIAKTLCTDPSDNLYIVTVFGNYDVAPGSCIINFAEDWGLTDEKAVHGDWDIGITKIDSGGNYCWTHIIGGASHDNPGGVCTDAAGNFYITGMFGIQGEPVGYTVNFAEDWGGTDLKTNVRWADIFTTKIAADGSYCWTRTMGGPNNDWGRSICTDSSANIYIVGTFDYGDIDFGADWGATDQRIGDGNDNIFVTKAR